MDIDSQRRRLIGKFAVVAGGVFFGRLAWAEDVPGWPAKAFSQIDQSAALSAVTSATPKVSSQVLVHGPNIVENGAVVPITVETDLPDVKRITLLVPVNPLPLAAIFDIPHGTEPYISARLKMNGTSDVVAVVETAHGVYQGKTSIKVTRGGCGG